MNRRVFGKALASLAALAGMGRTKPEMKRTRRNTWLLSNPGNEVLSVKVNGVHYKIGPKRAIRGNALPVSCLHNGQWIELLGANS